MIVLDANLLIYAGVTVFPEHARAVAWLDEQLHGASPVGFPWSSILSYLRITTNAHSFRHPQSMNQAWAKVEAWLSAPPAWIPTPTDRHQQALREVMDSTQVSGNLVPDADLAALALEHGLIVCSNDADFRRFPKIRLFNPLAT